MRTRTKLYFKTFSIIRAKKPTNGSNHWWTNTIGVSVSGFDINLPENQYIIFHRVSGRLNKSQFTTNNIDDLGTYKKDDIIKSKGSYVKIDSLSLDEFNIYINGEDLGTGLKRHFPITMREMKTYNNLSDNIKKKLEKQKKEFIEKKKNFDKDLKEMLKQKNTLSGQKSQLSILGNYQVQRK